MTDNAKARAQEDAKTRALIEEGRAAQPYQGKSAQAFLCHSLAAALENEHIEKRAALALLNAAVGIVAALERDVKNTARPITMQDVRLAVGEGKLTPADVLNGCNAELRRRELLA